jgi:hypothetical protein
MAQGDANLASEVRHQLAMLTHYTVFDHIGYPVNGNRVELTGEVAVALNKDDAQAAIKSLEDIGQINDQIKILPPLAMDDQIRRAE